MWGQEYYGNFNAENPCQYKRSLLMCSHWGGIFMPSLLYAVFDVEKVHLLQFNFDSGELYA